MEEDEQADEQGPRGHGNQEGDPVGQTPEDGHVHECKQGKVGDEGVKHLQSNLAGIGGFIPFQVCHPGRLLLAELPVRVSGGRLLHACPILLTGS